MFKKNMFLYALVVFLSVFSFNLMTVDAYFIKISAPVIGSFSIKTFYKDTYTYNLVDSNNTVTKLGEKVLYKNEGDSISIDAPDVDVSNYEFQSITINGSGSYSIGDTYTQTASDLSIVYTYKIVQEFSVTHNNGSFTFNGESTAKEGSTYTATITGSGFSQITGVTVTMGGRDLDENTDFTYNNNTLTIPNVSGDISINVTTQTCLTEGTKVMLWNGKTKNIEDIKYTDLLKVWNHDTGSYGFEYAGWIEKAGKSNSYVKVTFSDGNTLNIVGDHSLFSKRLNKYVNINSNDLKIGDEVVNLSNGISYVKITNIEKVEEKINYYHVISARYFNLITNNILSTYEIYSNVSNFMDFDNNMKWLKTEEVRKDMYTIDDLPNMEKYLFKVFRLEETKYLLKNGLVSKEEFDDLYNNYLLDNNKKVTPPKNDKGKYMWMVTTSDDIDPSDTSHQLEEDSEYVVPTPKKTDGFLYWYNHSNNKKYNPGDVIKVDSGMYLEAIYE